MPNQVPQIDEWLPAAMALTNVNWTAKVPRWAYHEEARKVANFCTRYWAPSTFAGRTLPGLSSGLKAGSILSEKTADEIRALELAAHELHHRYVQTFDMAAPSPLARGDELWREIRAALVYLLDDGVDDARDVQLAKIDAAHADSPATQGAIALRLDDYARYAKEHEGALRGLGGFDVGDIDEAIALASVLRDRPNEPLATSPETRAALDLRDRFHVLLDQRVEAVRAAARFVFRDHPEIAQNATSRYLRKQRAAQRAAQKKASEPAE